MLYDVSHQDFDTWQKKNAETSEMHGITTLNKQQVGMLQDEALAGTSSASGLLVIKEEFPEYKALHAEMAAVVSGNKALTGLMATLKPMMAKLKSVDVQLAEKIKTAIADANPLAIEIYEFVNTFSGTAKEDDEQNKEGNEQGCKLKTKCLLEVDSLKSLQQAAKALLA